MDTTEKRLLLCNCQRTMAIDGRAIGDSLGCSASPRVYTELCRAEISAFEHELASGVPLHVSCTQEAALFSELAEEQGHGDVGLQFTNIRERAGWTSDPSATTAKMAALLAEAAFVPQATRSIPLESTGICLVYGAGQQAFDVATRLADNLSVTLLLSDASDIVLPQRLRVPIYKGRIRRLSGHLGAFEIEVDGYAAMLPSSRRDLSFSMPRDGARASCELIFDLSGNTPLLSEAGRRDGYRYVDPKHPAAVADAMLALTDMVGEFEKPLYVAYDASICAHARSGIVGCARCVDACPIGAIAPAGDTVEIDHAVCAGCGACSTVCPTGAVSYAYPGRDDLAERARRLLQTFAKAGGSSPVILLHEDPHGSDAISAMARFGRGLPAHILPMAVHSITEVGHELFLTMLALGAARIALLAPPSKRDELDPVREAIALTHRFIEAMGHDVPRFDVLAEADPDAIETALYDAPSLAPVCRADVVPQRAKRDQARLALGTLLASAPSTPDIIALPAGAPYGRIQVDTDACTLCLSCVGACPANALSDAPDRPHLAFVESACVQCGICKATCPESAIRLEPRYDFRASAADPVVLKTEDPFDCVRCGKPFGTKASVERVLDRLKGHAMFRNDAQLQIIQMCENCRVIAQSERTDDPMRAGARPRVVTTDDYIEAERAQRNGRRTPDDFIDD